MSDNHLRVGPVEPVYSSGAVQDYKFPRPFNYSPEKKTIEQNELEIKEDKIKKECSSCKFFVSNSAPRSGIGDYGKCSCEEFRSKVMSKEVHSSEVQWYSKLNVLEVDMRFCCEHYVLVPDEYC